MENSNVIAGGVPMSLEQMREYLTDFYGIPVVLRKEGTEEVRCVYCSKVHHHPVEPGHCASGCDDDSKESVELTIGQRSFMPTHGYAVIHCREEDDVNIVVGN